MHKTLVQTTVTVGTRYHALCMYYSIIVFIEYLSVTTSSFLLRLFKAFIFSYVNRNI